MMNAGKIMEQQFRKSASRVPGLYYYRLKDGTASFYGGQQDDRIRFQASNIADAIMFRTPILYIIEMKSHRGQSLPLSKIRSDQLKGLTEASGYTNIVAGFVVDFSEKNQVYFARAAEVNFFIQGTNRASIPLAWFEQHGIRIGTKKLKVNKLYDVESFVNQMAAAPKPQKKAKGG